MIVAITGGSGFIGRRLVARHLALGDDVRVLTRNASAAQSELSAARYFVGDLASDCDLVSFVDRADLLYHGAAEILDATRMRAVHVGGTGRLLAAAAGRIGRWVQLSSTGAYGPQREGVVDEHTPQRPADEYEITKAEADTLVTASGSAFERVILRPSNVYGPDMTNQSLFGMISMLAKGMFFFIGKRGASANYIHVDNVVDALMLCGSSPLASASLFNVSDHAPLERFIALICAALDKQPPRVRVPESVARLAVKLVPGTPLTASRIDALTSRVRYSTARIESTLGYSPTVTMQAGLAQLVQAWQARRGSR